MDPHVFTFKLVLLGESAVGKSSLVMRFVKDEFHEYQESTIGAAFFTQVVQVGEDTVKFEIWDTAGQERYHSLAPMYYRGARAGIVVYDITSYESFERAKAWVAELQQSGSMSMVIALAGNKVDLGDLRQVSEDMARTYCAEQGIFFMETSAKTAVGVKDLFRTIAFNMPRTRRPGAPGAPAAQNAGGQRLPGALGAAGAPAGTRPQGGGCCS